jgi:hypothetical protein
MKDLIAILDEWSNKEVGDGKWKVTPPGKVGVWRRAANKNVFYPDDGGSPEGLPDEADDGRDDEAAAKQDELLAQAKSALSMLEDKLKNGNKKQKKLAKKKIPRVKALIKALESGDSAAIKKASGRV